MKSEVKNPEDDRIEKFNSLINKQKSIESESDDGSTAHRG